MANVEINDLGLIPSLQDTTAFEVQTAPGDGGLSYQTTMQQISAKVLSTVNSHGLKVYVDSKVGINAIGRGSSVAPYATISYALSQITDNSTYYYLIEANGVFTEVNWIIKPNISYRFNNSQLTVTGNVSLDPSWSAGGICYIDGLYNSTFANGVNLDFDAINAAFSLIQISNVNVSVGSAFTIKGNPSDTTIAVVENLVGFTTQPDVAVSLCYGAVVGGAVAKLDLTEVGFFSVNNCQTLSDFSILCTNNMQLFIRNSLCMGTQTFEASGSAVLDVYSTGTRYLSPPTLQCTSPGSVNFVVDFLTSPPVLVGDATFTSTSIADAVNANFSPTVYTPTDPSVRGNLEGIDNYLSSIPGNGLDAAYQVDNTITIAGGNSVELFVDNTVPAIKRTSTTVGVNNQILDILRFSGLNNLSASHDYVDVEILQRLNLTAPLNIDSAQINFYLLENAVKTLYFLIDSGNRYIQFLKDTQFIDCNMTMQRNTSATPDWRFFSNVVGTLNQISALLSSRSLSDTSALKTVDLLKIFISDPTNATFSQNVSMSAYNNNANRVFFEFTGNLATPSTKIINSTTNTLDQIATLSDISGGSLGLNASYLIDNTITIAGGNSVELYTDNTTPSIKRISTAVGTNSQILDILRFSGLNNLSTPRDYVDIEIDQRLNLDGAPNIDSAAIKFYLLENAAKTLYFLIDSGKHYLQFLKETQFFDCDAIIRRTDSGNPLLLFYLDKPGSLNDIVLRLGTKCRSSSSVDKTTQAMEVSISNATDATFSQDVTMSAYNNNAARVFFQFTGSTAIPGTKILNSTTNTLDQIATLSDIRLSRASFRANNVQIFGFIDANPIPLQTSIAVTSLSPQLSSDFSINTINGLLTYTGTTKTFNISYSISVSASGTNAFSFYIGRNGTALTDTRQSRVATANAGNVGLVYQLTLNNGDTLRPYVANMGSPAIDITIQDLAASIFSI